MYRQVGKLIQPKRKKLNKIQNTKLKHQLQKKTTKDVISSEAVTLNITNKESPDWLKINYT